MAEIVPIAENRQAGHHYQLFERIEAGLALTGPEVKSLRRRQAQLKDSYGLVRGGEALLLNCHISPYANAGYAPQQPDRTRKLLLHKRELERLEGRLRQDGLTLIPLRLYWRGGRVKCELALARGKQLFDKREQERARAADREAQQAWKERRRR